MRFALMALLVAIITAPLIGCHEKTETDKNPITGSTTTEKTMN